MSRYNSPKLTPKDIQGYHVANAKKGGAHLTKSPLRVGVPNADRISQIGSQIPALTLLNPKDVYFRELVDKYAALERHAVEVTEENARLNQILLESNVKERAKFESLISLTNPNFASQHVQLKHNSPPENTARVTQNNITGEATISEAYQAILGIYTQSKSLAPILTMRQELAKELAEDTLRRKAELGQEMEKLKKKDQKKLERMTKRALKHQTKHERYGKEITNPNSLQKNYMERLGDSRTVDGSFSMGEFDEPPTPFHALGLSIPEARFRLSLRTGSDVHVWAEGEWVHGTISRVKTGTLKSQLMQTFEEILGSEPPILSLNELSSHSAASTPHSTPLKPRPPPTIGGYIASLDPPVGIGFTEQHVTGSPVDSASEIVPLELPLHNVSKVPDHGSLSTPSMSPHTPSTTATSQHGNASASWTPLLNSAVLSGQTRQSQDNLNDAARWLASSYIEIRVGRMTITHSILSSAIADAKNPAPSNKPSDIDHEMQTRMKNVQRNMDRGRTVNRLDVVTDELDQLSLTLERDENPIVKEDTQSESDDSDEDNAWSDHDFDEAFSEDNLIHYLDTETDVNSKLPPTYSGDEMLSRQKSPLIRVTTGEGDSEALKAELSVMRLVAKKLSDAFSPIDSSILATIEPALRNVNHSKKICERVANSLKSVVAASAKDLKDFSKNSESFGRLSAKSQQEERQNRKNLFKYAKQVELLRGELLVLEPPLLSICERLHQVALETPGDTIAYLNKLSYRPKRSEKNEEIADEEAILPFGSWVSAVSGMHALSNVLFSTQVEILELIKDLRSLIDETDQLLSSLGLPPKIILIPESSISDQPWVQELSLRSEDPVFSVIFSESRNMTETSENDFSKLNEMQNFSTASNASSTSSPNLRAQPKPFVASLVPPSLLRGPSILYEDANHDPEDAQSAEEARQKEKEEQIRKSDQIELRRRKRREDEAKKQEEDIYRRYKDTMSEEHHSRNNRSFRASDSDSSEPDSSSYNSGQRFDDDILSADTESETETGNERFRSNGSVRGERRSSDSFREEYEDTRRNRDPAVVKNEERRQRRHLRETRKAEKLEQRLRENQHQLERDGYSSLSFLHNQSKFGFSNQTGQSQEFGWNTRPFYSQQNQIPHISKWQKQSQALHNTSQPYQSFQSFQSKQTQQTQQYNNNNSKQFQNQSASTSGRWNQNASEFSSYSQNTKQTKYLQSQFEDTRPYSPRRFQPLVLPPQTSRGDILKARTQLELQAMDCASKLVHLSPANCTIENYHNQLTNFENLLWIYEQLTSKLQAAGVLPRDSISPDLLALLRYESLQPAIKNVIAAVEGRYHPSNKTQNTYEQLHPSSSSTLRNHAPLSNQHHPQVVPSRIHAPTMPSRSIEPLAVSPLLNRGSATVHSSTPSAPVLRAAEPPPLTLSLSTPVVSDDDEPPGGLAPPSLTRAGPNLT